MRRPTRKAAAPSPTARGWPCRHEHRLVRG